MKPRQNLFRLMFKEINDGSSALASFFSGQPFPEKKNKQAANVFNYLVYQRRKKTIINKAG